MSAILNGSELGKAKREDVRIQTEKFFQQHGVQVCLVIVQAGDNPSSASYVRNTLKLCEQAGIKGILNRVDEDITQEQLLQQIHKLNKDKTVHGILLQLPLPRHINESVCVEAINPLKDVDGVTTYNSGSLYLGKECLMPNTPLGVMELIKATGVSISGKKAVVLGRSNIVGKPAAIMLMQNNATVTICHSKTVNLKEICLSADILVAAIGKPNFVAADMIKKGAIVIDVGVNYVDGKICGDVDFENANKVAGFISPVPGGSGPMTVTMLLANTLKAAKMQTELL